MENLSARELLELAIPISRFNKGEAGKIFDELKDSGMKVVMKNNKPAGVLLTPEKYLEVMETVENYYLLTEAENRLKANGSDKPLTQDQVMERFNIKERDLKDVEVDIEE